MIRGCRGRKPPARPLSPPSPPRRGRGEGEGVVRNFSRYHKYTLGSDLRQQSRELVTLIIRANSRRDKLPVLYDLRERLVESVLR